MLNGRRQLYSLRKSRRHFIDIAKDVEARFDTLNCELDRPMPKGKNKKEIGLKTHGQISKKCCFKKNCSCDNACQFSAL